MVIFGDVRGYNIPITRKHLMTVTLFVIGAGLGRDELKKIGYRPLFMAVTLWLIISLLSLAAVIKGFMPNLNI